MMISCPHICIPFSYIVVRYLLSNDNVECTLINAYVEKFLSLFITKIIISNLYSTIIFVVLLYIFIYIFRPELHVYQLTNLK